MEIGSAGWRGVGFCTCCGYGGNRGRGMSMTGGGGDLVASSLEYAVEERLQPDLSP